MLPSCNGIEICDFSMQDERQSGGGKTCTLFKYSYRDAGNFKSCGSVLLSGRLSQSERQLIEGKMESSEFFIAEEIGITPLYASLYAYSGGMTDEDHVWHFFEEFEDVCDSDNIADMSCWGTCEEFAQRFELVSSWNLTLSPHARMT